MPGGKQVSSSLEQIFLSPPARFRGVPFWAWNCRVTKERIDWQAECFFRMGMGGAMVHPRTGMATPYLSREYMELVCYAQEKLRSLGLSCWLYDEDRFPSGSAGGIVTRELKFRSRTIVVSDRVLEGYCAGKAEFDARAEAGEKPKGYFLADYRIAFRDGRLSSYHKVSRGGNYHAYVSLMEEDPWFNGETYVDVLNPDAVAAFLRVTH